MCIYFAVLYYVCSAETFESKSFKLSTLKLNYTNIENMLMFVWIGFVIVVLWACWCTSQLHAQNTLKFFELLWQRNPNNRSGTRILRPYFKSVAPSRRPLVLGFHFKMKQEAVITDRKHLLLQEIKHGSFLRRGLILRIIFKKDFCFCCNKWNLRYWKIS